MKKLLDDESRDEGTSYKVMMLTAPDDPKTIHLDGPVVNDLESDSGRPTAFTQNQRYVSLERLKKAKGTSGLVND